MATKKAASTKKKAPAVKTAQVKTTVKTVTSAPAATKNTFIGHVQQSVRTAAFWRSLGAEFVGTFLLAAVVVAGQGQPIFVLFALVGIVLAIGAISGAHVNPAITIGAFVTRRIGWLRAVGYIVVQLLGAALAYVTLSAFIGGAAQPSAEEQLYGQAAPTLFAAIDLSLIAGKELFVLFAELLGTAILGFALANATRDGKDRLTTAFIAGLGLFIAIMVAATAAGYVGASAILNPAIAITLHAFDWSNAWTFAVYALAPVVGGILGFILYDVLRDKNGVESTK